MGCFEKSKSKYLIAKPKPNPESNPEPKQEPIIAKAKITEVRLFGRWLILKRVSYIEEVEL
jgi:hypothetical protein